MPSQLPESLELYGSKVVAACASVLVAVIAEPTRMMRIAQVLGKEAQLRLQSPEIKILVCGAPIEKQL